MGRIFLVDENGTVIKTLTLSDASQDVDGDLAVLTASVLFARKDADTVIPVACDSSGYLKITL